MIQYLVSWNKTGLALGTIYRKKCHLDSEVYAVGERVAEVFQIKLRSVRASVIRGYVSAVSYTSLLVSIFVNDISYHQMKQEPTTVAATKGRQVGEIPWLQLDPASRCEQLHHLALLGYKRHDSLSKAGLDGHGRGCDMLSVAEVARLKRRHQSRGGAEYRGTDAQRGVAAALT
jgi:hypothetical protein